MGASRLTLDYREGLAPGHARALQRLAAEAERLGSAVYLVGGSVRDLLLGLPPRDLDVVVGGDVERLARGLAVQIVSQAEFQTLRVRFDDGTELDLARARQESYAHPAALPSVTPATLDADLPRRDFTINALALPLGPPGAQRVIDRVGGLADLRQGLVRVLHRGSFMDDPTRAFRAIKLAARLGFSIEPQTARWLRAAVRSRVFDRLSAARLGREWTLLLEDVPRLASTVRGLAAFGLMSTLHPGLRAPRGLGARLEAAGSLIEWCGGLPGGQPPRLRVVAFALLLEDLDAEATRSVLRRLGGERELRLALDGATAGIRDVVQALTDAGGRVRPSRIYRVASPVPVEWLLVALVRARRPGVRRALRSYLERLRGVRLEISGRDLLRAGVAPGPGIARGLEAALMAKLDGEAPGAREQLLTALRSIGPA